MTKKKISKQPSPDPGIVLLRFRGEIFRTHPFLGWTPPDGEDLILRFRLLGPKECDQLEHDIISSPFPNSAGWDHRRVIEYCAHVIVLSVVDSNGNKVFTEKDEPAIREKWTPAYMIANAIIWENLGERWKKNPLIEKRLRFWPGKTARDLYPVVLPQTNKKEKMAAVERLYKKHPTPIFRSFWNIVRDEVKAKLEQDADGRRDRDGGEVSWEDELKCRLFGALVVGASAARQETGIFPDDKDLLRKFKAKYRKDAEETLGIIRQRGQKKKKPARGMTPEDKAVAASINGGLTARPGDSPTEGTAELGLLGLLDLQKRFEQLSTEDQKTIRALEERGGDRKAAAKDLKITATALKTRICRLRERLLPDS